MAKLNKYLLLKILFIIIFFRNSDQGFLINPNSHGWVIKKNGDRIINGFLNHQGESFPINDFGKQCKYFRKTTSIVLFGLKI